MTYLVEQDRLGTYVVTGSGDRAGWAGRLGWQAGRLAAGYYVGTIQYNTYLMYLTTCRYVGINLFISLSPSYSALHKTISHNRYLGT